MTSDEDVAWETPSQEQRNVASEKSLKNAILAIGANHRGFREAMLQFAAEGDEISARVDADALDLELWS